MTLFLNGGTVLIYLDNAATTYPKPYTVVQGIVSATKNYGGNPGRSGHTMSLRAAALVYDTRKKAAALFHAEPENVIFTSNCTHALNMAIKGAVPTGGHVILSALEHNAVLRPVYAMSQTAGVTYSLSLIHIFNSYLACRWAHWNNLLGDNRAVFQCNGLKQVNSLVSVKVLADAL